MKNKVREKQQQKATASDVAELVGVSKWTVLRAFKNGASISPKVREQVLEAANRLGFRPNLLARGLKQRKTNIIGVVTDEFNNPHTLKMLSEVSHQLNERGYMMLLLNTDSQENYRSVLEMAGQLQVDGLLFLATILSDELILTAESVHQVPSVHVCRNTDTPDVEVVNIDGFAAGGEMGQLLLDQGYQRFGYMEGRNTETTHLLRMEGYQSVLQAAGKKLDILLKCNHYDREIAYRAMSDYLRVTPAESRIDALFCENDVLAFGAMQAIRDYDADLHIGIVGFDDVEEARTTTWNLTTWAQRSDLQIAEALNRLLGSPADEQGPWRYGELRIRRSHLNPAADPISEAK